MTKENFELAQSLSTEINELSNLLESYKSKSIQKEEKEYFVLRNKKSFIGKFTELTNNQNVLDNALFVLRTAAEARLDEITKQFNNL